MEIVRAKEMGFCPGVRRAIEMVEKATRQGNHVYSLGALVHNRQVVARLADRGVTVIRSLSEVGGGLVAITSHGAAPQVIEEIKSRGLDTIDTTCPFVRKAQMAARRLAEAGFKVVIFGDAAHPEIQGVLGWVGERVLATLDASTLGKLPRRVGVLSQTTQSQIEFAGFVNQVVRLGLADVSELRVVNTICDSTQRRQAAAVELARQVDVMVVVGGYDSANTRRLAEVSASCRVTTHHVETAAELEPAWFAGKGRIGVTAGASTPDEIIEEVIAKLKEIDHEKAGDPTPNWVSGIYLNPAEDKVLRVSSPFRVPLDGWVLLTPEVNATLARIRELARERGLVQEPGRIIWADWADLGSRNAVSGKENR